MSDKDPCRELAKAWMENHGEPRSITQLADLIRYVQKTTRESTEAEIVVWIERGVRDVEEHMVKPCCQDFQQTLMSGLIGRLVVRDAIVRGHHRKVQCTAEASSHTESTEDR